MMGYTLLYIVCIPYCAIALLIAYAMTHMMTCYSIVYHV